MSFRPLLACSIALVAVGVFALACSVGPAPASQSPRDPSSPLAPEGASPLALAEPAEPRPPHEAQHPPHAHGAAPASVEPATADGGAGGVVYVCPMDPEITSSAPGLCPKCNMKLVPKK
ncbi:MAG: hypothetical protein KIS78_05355 [Labilithrix sp.]|nr:hypothetical protein [Labilithrix sp.]MCW5831863.1 hypothetical protein [Labilithrix sp.]